MCSFLVTNKDIENLDEINLSLKRRGPDSTTVVKKDGVTFLHNLLHITGQKTVQPLEQEKNIMLYNGEVYNYKGASDTQFVFDELCKDIINGAKSLEGEFAVVFYSGDKIHLITDIFGTKPLFYAKNNNTFGISSYYSVLVKLNFTNIKRVEPNTIFELYSETKTVLNQFNLSQTVDDFNEWEDCFLKSVEKRINHESFLCLSSGYDSGAIALASKILDKKIKLYCIYKHENLNVIKEREKFLGQIEYIDVDDQTYLKHFNIIDSFGDTFMFSDYNYKADRASIGLSVILSQAIKDNKRVSISGSGADEIISDYGINGRSVFFMDNTSTLKGVFPKDLADVFPWNNFYRGRQEKYLYKEESVAGCHGIETRYPFLDRNTVQSFLNITSTKKNSDYKAPIASFFMKHGFSFEPHIKRGFNI